ncbi:hypothetical protein Pint_11952 [Pistacia integerrima]|uniref:Uncharacterized protein n=1 Tax=Pistacia integerrima TaxID=434235 RepID=A0ACC0XI55_9ROSI|nr:hypothetical protein Pint_11952 [Pistacia integerrima]
MAKGNTSPLSLPIPIFTGENYDVWSIKMKTYFLSQDLWEIVNYENNLEITDSTLSKQQQEQLTEQQQEQLKEQQQEQLKESNENDAAAHFKQQQEQLKESKKKDAAALFILQQAVDDNIFRKIAHAKKAKKAWDTLKKEFQGIPQTTTLAEGREPEDFKKYLPLYKNILEGDLKSVRELCDKDENALEARITVNLDTALHVAVGTGKANHIVEYLLNKMSMDQVSLKNKEGNTVLSVAAIVSNVRAASMILIKDKDQSLIHNLNNSKRIPLVEATRHGQKEMVNYLLQISMKDFDYNSATRFTSGVLFAKYLIIAEFYGELIFHFTLLIHIYSNLLPYVSDLALDLLNHRPILATMTFYGGDSLLSEITRKPSAFPSGGTRKLPFREYFRFSKDALSLFSSIAAAIIFMSIITARYKQDDFLKALPRKFILGVVIMFISITSMMVAFGTTVYQIFYEKRAYLTLGLVGVSACLPMLLFMASQFSLIWHLFIYTYRPGLFSKPSN